jgi:hypothetical protein
MASERERTPRQRRSLGALAIIGACELWSCSTPPTAREQPPATLSRAAVSTERVRALREREGVLRSAFTPATQPPWIDVSGADPYRIAEQPNGSGFVGVLRGGRALVTLDAQLVELQRVALPETPTALCVATTNDAWVASRYGSRLVRIGLGPVGAARSTLELDLRLSGVADLACGDAGLVYVLPADGSELLTLDGAGRVLGRRAAMPGPLRLQRTGRYLLESSLFERSLRVLELTPSGLPGREVARIRHDGTLWAFDARASGSELLIAAAGVEDKALVRAHGEFENIDSFVWLYRMRDGLERVASLDVSDSGVVVPKAVHLEPGVDSITLTVLAAGSGRLLRARWSGDPSAPPRLETLPAPPGVSDAVFEADGSVDYADPLFDAWIKLDAVGTHIQRVDPERRPDPDVRLGEALFFTELMAPENSSAGTHSRFSCETCHFEGGVDGRLHYTGRADVSVVTKPLFGLANNRPHFSRALDRDLSSVCHNEFRVAGAGSGTDPWFALATARFPWLYELGIARAELGPLEQREALLKFLYAFSHAPNPKSQGRTRFSALEAEGARAFQEHCQSCHSARVLSDDPASEVPFADWQNAIFSRNAPLSWARAEYAKTGILPYVHEHGTRITSLRRLALKPRYFTNGSAPDLANVLERFREGGAGERALHDATSTTGLADLPRTTRPALLAFLQLL